MVRGSAHVAVVEADQELPSLDSLVVGDRNLGDESNLLWAEFSCNHIA